MTAPDTEQPAERTPGWVVERVATPAIDQARSKALDAGPIWDTSADEQHPLAPTPLRERMGHALTWLGIAIMLATVAVLGTRWALDRDRVNPDTTPFDAPSGVAANANGPRVIVVADAAAAAASAEIEGSFGAAGWSAPAAAHSAGTADSATALVRGALSRHPDALVLALSRDLLQPALSGDPIASVDDPRVAGAIAQQQALLDEASTAGCVVWANAPDWSPAAPGVGVLGPALNRALDDALASHPTVHRADLAARLRPSWVTSAEWLQTNFDAALQPTTAEGRSAVAALLTDAVRASCGL